MIPHRSSAVIPSARLLTILFALLAPGTGAAVPVRLETTLLDRQPLVLAAPTGRVLLINYWATWCAPCREEMLALDRLYATYHAQGLDVVGISLDEPGDLAQVRRLAAGVHYPVGLQVDTEMRGLGRVWSAPMNYLVGRQGEVVLDGQPGFRPGDMAALEARITALLAMPAQRQR